MKTIILSALLMVTTFAYSQEVIYTNGILTLENRKNNTEKNIGKNVTLKYDSFFKNYTVLYTDFNGTRKKMVFYNDGSIYNNYIYNGIEFTASNMLLHYNFAKDGNAAISFVDLRNVLYGGTEISYHITNLKIK